MKILRFYLKKNKIFSVRVKDKSCNHPKGLQLCLKETPTQVFSCEYSKSFRDAIFHRANPVTAVELCFSIRKEFSKRKFSGEFALALISLVHVQIQLPAKRSTTTIAFVFLAKFADFFITKGLKQEVNDILSICTAPCGICITEDIKIYHCHVMKK